MTFQQAGLPHARAGRTAPAIPLILALVYAAGLAACGGPQVELLNTPDGTRMTLLSEQAPTPGGVDPSFRDLTPLAVEASLRRITVTHATWVSLVQSDPEPLLTVEQIKLLRKPLADALAAIRPDQRVLVRFKDRFKNLDVHVAVYADGTELVYAFSALSRDMERARASNESVDQAKLVEQPGQALTRTSSAGTLREPIRAGDMARAEFSGRMRQRVEQAYERKALSIDEREQLLAIATAQRAPGEEAWNLFWERWELLQKAHTQELVDDTAFAQRKAELIGTLQR